MSRRWLVAAIGLVLMGAAVFSFAGGHHHDHSTLARAPDCALCAWHLQATTDVPVATEPMLHPPQPAARPVPAAAVGPLVGFVLSQASRAPPALLA